MRKTGLKVGEVEIGARSNAPLLLEPDKFYWFKTNFLSFEYTPFRADCDSFIEILDENNFPSMEINKNILRLRGNFSAWEKETRDLRYTIFGNLGIFSAWVLRTLEEAKNIYTFHACGLVKGNKLLIIPGGAGAGKSVFIFSALSKGWRIFSTEFIHFRVGESVEFFKGSMQDAVRVDTFKFHFPEIAEKLGVHLEAEAGGKLVVDLSPFQVEDYVLKDPEIVLVFPHVEEKRERLIFNEIKDREVILRNLFHSASEKIDKSLLLYGRLAVSGVDSQELAQKRYKNLDRFLKFSIIKNSFVWVSGVKEIDNIFDKV